MKVSIAVVMTNIFLFLSSFVKLKKVISFASFEGKID